MIWVLPITVIALQAGIASIVPVYGSAAAHDNNAVSLVLLALLAVALKPKIHVTSTVLLAFSSFWLIITPILHKEFLFPSSMKWGPHWGPSITFCTTIYPVLFCLCVIVIRGIRQTTLWAYVMVTVTLLTMPNLLNYLNRCALNMSVGLTLFALSRQWTLMPLFVPAILHSITHNPQCFAPLSKLNESLEKDNFSILDRLESTTGVVSVLQGTVDGHEIRVLRNDHSLLGGEFLRPPEDVNAPKTNGPFNGREPIFGVFNLLEAVRLVQHRGNATQKHALVIGLGVGTAAAGLMYHGEVVDVVEIDPVVYHFAREYFYLPRPNATYLEDASQVLEYLPDDTYDYVLHDVFGGGSVPGHLFTKSFWQQLSRVMKPDGIVAVNFAGDLSSPAVESVFATLANQFSFCRSFRDQKADSGHQYANLVTFCSNLLVTFRRAEKQDFLGSLSRLEYLSPTYQVNLQDKADAQILESGEVLDRMQHPMAIGHWYLMRKLLPSRVWENW